MKRTIEHDLTLFSSLILSHCTETLFLPRALPSVSYITRSLLQWTLPEVLKCGVDLMLVRPDTVQHTVSTLITFVPLTQCASSCLLGATWGQNPFERLNVNISSPIIFAPELLFFACSLVDSVSWIQFFCLFALVCSNFEPVNNSVDDNPQRFLCFFQVFSFFFSSLCCCAERGSMFRSASRWTEVSLWARRACSHTHTDRKYQGLGVP